MIRWQTLPALVALAVFGTAALAETGPPKAEALPATLATQPELTAIMSGASAIMAGYGLTPQEPTVALPPPVPDFPDTGTAVLELVDLRFLLAQIAAQTGAKDHQLLIHAQPTETRKVILLRGGFVSLAVFQALSQSSPAADFVRTGPDGITLLRPLAIWSDAGLHLQAGDQLHLSRESGSFVANLGWLQVDGGSLSGTGAPNVAEPQFRPFVLTAGAGNLTVQDATLSDLGFGDSALFGGIAVSTAVLATPSQPVLIRHNRLGNVSRVALLGTNGAAIADNHFNTGTILLSRSQGARVSGNLLRDSTGNQAIRITAGSSGITVSGNAVHGTTHAGITAEKASSRISILGNVVGNQANSGISVTDADCVWLAGNLVAANDGAGISLTDTGGVTVSGNAILRNGASGILLRDQSAAARVRIAGNVFSGNREGMRGATPGRVDLVGNAMEAQRPRLFSGDMALQTVAWLEQRARTRTATVLARETAPPCLTGGAD